MLLMITMKVLNDDSNTVFTTNYLLLLERVEQWTKECLAMAEQKVLLASEVLELVQSHTKKLDRDLARYRALEIQRNKRAIPSSLNKQISFEPSGRGRKKDSGSVLKTSRTKLNNPAPMQYIPPSSKDPNAEKFCTCRRISFGEMIACDNPKCKIEWFHFECVGLTSLTRPKVKWLIEFYCTSHFRYRSISFDS